MQITLPWPPRALMPNTGKDKRYTVKEKNAYKWQVTLLCVQASFNPGTHAKLEHIFHPPDRRRRDIDNAFAGMKAARDAIAAFSGVDDQFWSFSMEWGEPTPGGAVVVRVG